MSLDIFRFSSLGKNGNGETEELLTESRNNYWSGCVRYFAWTLALSLSFAGLLLSLTSLSGASDAPTKNCTVVSDSSKFDCFPGDGADQQKCEARGCCWAPPTQQPLQPLHQPPLNVPWCYYPQSYGGYEYVNVTESSRGVTAFLQRTFPSGYPDDIPLLKMDVEYQGDVTLRVTIRDAAKDRFEPPYPEVPVGPDNPPRSPVYKVILQKDTLGFAVARTDGRMIFDARNVGGMIFADQFLQLSGVLNGTVYGLGEHQNGLALNTNWTRFVMFNHDVIPMENTNLYGSHPFYMVVDAEGSSHGVFLRNSDPMEVLLQPLPAITWRTIGGILDLYFLLGPTPQEVVRQYTALVGRPFMPPYWSLGFHLCRFGYKTVEELRLVWNRTREAGIPFDTQWNDIDYMDSNNDFTVDPTRYKDLPQFVAELHDAGMHYIPILDPGVSASEPNGSYPPYDDGAALGVLITNPDGSVFRGKVWNRNSTAFPDFTHPKTVIYWTHLLRRLHQQVAFDGLWIDMNEPSNFLDGEVVGCPNNSLEQPPYIPAVDGGKLRFKTVCMSAKQHAGLHYDLHNLYGIAEADVTSRALKEILGARPFIISRSTYAGQGKFSGHWSGDVTSTWSDMKLTVPQMLSFGLFGVPMVGADICGFNGNTTMHLCLRWTQLGAFYPFARNHNTDDGVDQDPVALGPEVVAAAVKALTVRYSLLPYLYTLFWRAHVDGDTVARPLFFEFPHDVNTHRLDESFLWGSSLLVVPVLEEFATTVHTYLPAGVWYDWYTGLGTWYNGGWVTLAAPTDTIPLLLRGGAILPTQGVANTTTASRKTDLGLVGAFNENQAAWGSLFWDEGDGLYNIEDMAYGLVEFTMTAHNLSNHVVHWNVTSAPPVTTVRLWGFTKPITKLLVNGTTHDFDWDATKLVLSVSKLNLNLTVPFTLSWE